MIKTLNNFNRNKTVSFKQIYADPLIKLKKYTGTFTNLGAGIDKNGYPVTGLTEDYTSTNAKGTITTHKGTRKELEKLLDLAEGTLKNTSKYWHSFFIKLSGESLDIKLDLTNAHDLLQYLFLRAQSFVANGLNEVKNNAKNEYVLFSEDEEAASRVTVRRILKKAYNVSESLDLETKMDILAVYGYIADAANVNTIEDKVDEFIEEDPKKFLEIVADDFLVYRSLLTKCLDKGILLMEKGAVMHGEVNVGYDKKNAAENIAANRMLQTVLKAKLSGDMDLISKALSKEKIKDTVVKK